MTISLSAQDVWAGHIDPAKDAKALGRARVVLLAIKPQAFAAVAPMIAPHLPEGALVISVLAGTSIKALSGIFPAQHIIRHLIDVVTAVSGSGPAYVFHMTEALEAAAIKIGLPEEIAPHFARQTIIGAGALLASSEQPASELRQAVTSPNGTTQAALDVLMPNLPALMRDTVKAALMRAKALAKGS